MVALMWYTEEKRLPQTSTSGRLRGAEGAGGSKGGKAGGSSPIDVVFLEGESAKGGEAPGRGEKRPCSTAAPEYVELYIDSFFWARMNRAICKEYLK